MHKFKSLIKLYLPIYFINNLRYFQSFLLNNLIAEKRKIKNYHKRIPRKIIEHMEFDFAMSRLNENKEIKILDIGAHHGEFSELCGTFNRFHNWKIFCVEPLKQNIKHIKKKKYTNVSQSIILIGISDISNIKTFTLGTADSLFTCEPEWKDKFPDHFKEAKKIDIQCLSISDMASKYLSSEETIFDFVKIDVEGHDLNVITSFCNSKLNSYFLMFEITEDIKNLEKSISLLKEKGLNEFHLFGRKGISTTYLNILPSSSEIERII